MSQQRSRIVGRRRADGSQSSVPREEIIRAATRLFADHGYGATTMTSVAKAAGLRQSSLYYWFKSKEELLHATASVNRYSAAIVAALDASRASAAVKLYRLLYEDTLYICELDAPDYHEVESVAYQNPDEFGEFWTDYRTLYEGVADLVRAGIEERRFHRRNPRLVAAVALSLNEGLRKLHSNHRSPAGALGLPVALPEIADPEAVAHQSASTTLAALLIDHRQAATIRARALRLAIDADRTA